LTKLLIIKLHHSIVIVVLSYQFVFVLSSTATFTRETSTKKTVTDHTAEKGKNGHVIANFTSILQSAQ